MALVNLAEAVTCQFYHSRIEVLQSQASSTFMGHFIEAKIYFRFWKNPC